LDFRLPLTVPELIRRSGASTGAVYRVVEFLQEEVLIRRAPRGPITVVEWRPLLERWSRDYGFQASNRATPLLAPRGLPAFFDQLGESKMRYAVTGSEAVPREAAHAPLKLAMVYVDDVDSVATELGLRAVTMGANILMTSTPYEVVFERTRMQDGLTCVAVAQAAVDLLSAPGRGPAEAEALLDWMEAHEGAWRQ
jgi:hypothetical protein